MRVNLFLFLKDAGVSQVVNGSGFVNQCVSFVSSNLTTSYPIFGGDVYDK